MGDMALPFGSLRAAAAALARREVSAVELVDLMLSRIDQLNPRLGAFTEVTAQTARREALIVDHRRQTGEAVGDLAGMPVAIKDILDTTPAVCTAGLPFLADYRPKRDAPVVRRLRRAGAVVVGVTATDPGAFGVRTAAVTHPQAPDLTVGGSSGGSSGGLAAGLCYAALGTDTGGSIRIPAACCLVAGLMPTYGRVRIDGVRPLSWSADHVGPMTRSVRDLAVVAPVLDPAFARSSGKTMRGRLVIGHVPSYWQDADHDVRQAMQRALEACRSLGAEIREVALPSPDETLEFHVVILAAEAAAYHFQAFPDRLKEYPPVAKQLLMLAKKHRGHHYVLAMRQRADATRRVDALFKEVDFLVLPTLAVLPPRRDAETVRVGGVYRDFTLALIRYTCLFDHTGHPVVSLPVSVLGPGVGTSAQIVGPRNSDADVLTFGTRLEKVLDLAIDYTIRTAA